jgi:hypothetical protein
MAKTKKKWFVPKHGSYIPVSYKGWLTYIPFLAFLVFSVIIVVDHSGSEAYKVFSIFTDWVSASVVMTWLARRLS